MHYPTFAGKKDNNDERRLFINVILNSVKKSVFGPTITCWDPNPDDNGTYTQNIVTPTEEGIYEMTVPNLSTIPEFTYHVSVPDARDEIEEVHIYYDRSKGTSGDKFGFVSGTDVTIFRNTTARDETIKKNLYKKIGSSIAALKLDEEYFKPYGNKYTYIVIAVKTKKGIYTTQRIMIKLAPKLWDLT